MHLVVGALLVRDDNVLLGHRAATKRWYPDVWDVIGGHVDDGETLEAALRREVLEELGVHVGGLDEPVAHLVDPAAPGGGLDLRIWVVDRWRGEVTNCAPEEHDALRWFGRHEAASLRLAHPALIPLLARLPGTRPPST